MNLSSFIMEGIILTNKKGGRFMKLLDGLLKFMKIMFLLVITVVIAIVGLGLLLEVIVPWF